MVVVITGASGFIGSAVTERLLPRHTIRSLTSHPQKNRFGERVRSILYDFERPERMDEAFEGADAFVHSYYIRFPHAGDTFERAVARAGILFERARRAGVRRIVHVSVSNANEASDLPYYRNKGCLERLVRESGLEFAILRPALVFGPGDILLNNIAWFLRRAPVFGIFGDGAYRVQPVALDGFGALDRRGGRIARQRRDYGCRGSGRLHVSRHGPADPRGRRQPRRAHPDACPARARGFMGHWIPRPRRHPDAGRGEGA